MGDVVITATRPLTNRDLDFIQAAMLRTGFIIGRSDWLWFILLPVIAVAFALGSHQFLPGMALASVGLWITIPHHFATWLRTFTDVDDCRRWSDRLVIGPLVIFGATILFLMRAPLTLLLLVLLWDHQHSIMQQHGFARIYDFKARTGSPSTRHFDLSLHWILFVNMLLTTPVFTTVWVRELHHWHLPITALTVQQIQFVSSSITLGYLAIYLVHVVQSLRSGHALNPMKYLFILMSYGLWYFTAWHASSILVWGIAHRIMHGVQYIVIVYWFMRRKEEGRTGKQQPLAGLAGRGKLFYFLITCIAYAMLYQMLLGQTLDNFGFGLLKFNDLYGNLPQLNIEQMAGPVAYEIYAETIITGFALTHYYYDSFIWKVRDTKTQRGL